MDISYVPAYVLATGDVTLIAGETIRNGECPYSPTHPKSAKKDFKMNEAMGGLVIEIPIER